VICNGALRIAAVVIFVILPGIIAAKTPQSRPLKVRVHFLATAASLRETWGTNEDTYLAEIAPHGGSIPVLVQLIDEYLTFEPPLSFDSLTSTTGTALRIIRDARCDIPYSQMQLRTAPGDPKALLHERLNYQPRVDERPQADTILPCYRTIRE
jgi:hypothetical protein